MVEECKYCSDVIKSILTKKLMTKKVVVAFENSTKCLICDNDCIDGDVKVRDHCHVTRK